MLNSCICLSKCIGTAPSPVIPQSLSSDDVGRNRHDKMQCEVYRPRHELLKGGAVYTYVFTIITRDISQSQDLPLSNKKKLSSNHEIKSNKTPSHHDFLRHWFRRLHQDPGSPTQLRPSESRRNDPPGPDHMPYPRRWLSHRYTINQTLNKRVDGPCPKRI